MKKTLFIAMLLVAVCAAAVAQTKKPAARPQPKGKAKSKVVAAPMPPASRTMFDDNGRRIYRVKITTDYGEMVLKLYNETPLHRDNFMKLVKTHFYDSLLFHRVINTFMIQGGDPASKYADTSLSLGAGDVGYKIPAEFNPKLFHKKGALAAARDNNPERASSGCQFYIVQGKTYTIKELENMINNKNMGRKQQILYDIYQRDSVQAKLATMQGENASDKEAIRAYIATLQPAADAEYTRKYPNATEVDLEQIQYYQQVGGTPQLDGDYTVFGEMESGYEVLDTIAKVPTRSSDNRPVKNVRMKIRLIE